MSHVVQCAECGRYWNNKHKDQCPDCGNLYGKVADAGPVTAEHLQRLKEHFNGRC